MKQFKRDRLLTEIQANDGESQVRFEQVTRDHLNSFENIPSTNMRNWREYINHRIMFLNRGIAIYTKDELIRRYFGRNTWIRKRPWKEL